MLSSSLCTIICFCAFDIIYSTAERVKTWALSRRIVWQMCAFTLVLQIAGATNWSPFPLNFLVGDFSARRQQCAASAPTTDQLIVCGVSSTCCGGCWLGARSRAGRWEAHSPLSLTHPQTNAAPVFLQEV